MLISKNAALLAFEAVAAHGTTHAAAKALGLTQTGVTQRIKGLEASLGFTLFLRSRRGMQATEEGLALLQLCRAGRELEGEFQSRTQGQSRTEMSLTIVGPTSAMSMRVARQVAPLYERFPFLRLHLRIDDPANPVELVRRGEADLALVCPEEVPNEMDSKVLKPDRYLLVASAKWKGRRLADILENERIIDFYESDPMTRRYLRRFGEEKRAKRERLFVNENHALVSLVAAGVGYCTLVESIAAPWIASGALVALNGGRAMEDPIALAWYPRARKIDYFAEVVKAIV